MIVAFVVIGMFAVMACTGPARADATADTLASARAAHARHDYATELKLLRPLAEQGNADAQTWPGPCTHKGEGVPQNHAEAMKLYEGCHAVAEAAEQGNALGAERSRDHIPRG